MEEKKSYQNHNEWRKVHYNAGDINDKLVINLQDLSHTIRFLYEGRGSQKRILMILEEIGHSITQQELTELIGIKPGSASEVLAKLENTGYIKRTPSEIDRRTVDVELTKSGELSAMEVRIGRGERHEEMFSCLSGDEKKNLLLLLEKVNDDWEKRYRNTNISRKQNR